MSSTGSFSEPGDSNSFVFNNTGEVAGFYGELTGNTISGQPCRRDGSPDRRGNATSSWRIAVVSGTRVHAGSGLVTSNGRGS